MCTLNLIVDMQNAYLPNQPWECPNIMEVIPNIELLCQQASNSDSSNSIVFTRYIASTNPVGTWKYYNQKYYDINSSKYLNEIIEALKPYTKKYPVYDKSTYSCYADSTLKSIIDQYDTISICGVVADCCILSTMLSLIDTGKQIVYLNDAIGEYGRGSKKAVDNIVKNMSIHVKSLSVKEYLNTI